MTDTTTPAAPDTLPTINVDDLTAPAWTTDPLGFAINADAAPAEIDTWGMIGDRPALPRRGLILIEGKQLAGKSLSTLALAAALLGDKDQFDNLAPINPRPNGIIFAEAEVSGGHQFLRRRHDIVSNTIGDLNAMRLLMLDLTGRKAAEMWGRLQKYVDMYNPAIVIIHDAQAFVKNVDDVGECANFCQKLCNMAQSRTVIAINSNNSELIEEDGRLKAESDSELVNELRHYCEEFYYVMHVYGQFMVVREDSRHVPCHTLREQSKDTWGFRLEPVYPGEKYSKKKFAELNHWALADAIVNKYLKKNNKGKKNGTKSSKRR